MIVHLACIIFGIWWGTAWGWFWHEAAMSPHIPLRARLWRSVTWFPWAVWHAAAGFADRVR